MNRLYVELGLKPLDPAVMRGLLDSIEYSHTKTHEDRSKPQSLSGVQTGALDRWRHQLSEDQLGWIGALSTQCRTVVRV